MYDGHLYYQFAAFAPVIGAFIRQFERFSRDLSVCVVRNMHPTPPDERIMRASHLKFEIASSASAVFHAYTLPSTQLQPLENALYHFMCG